MLRHEPYSCLGNHHSHSYWTSTLCWPLHKSRRNIDYYSNTTPVLREFTALHRSMESRRLGSRAWGKTRKVPRIPGRCESTGKRGSFQKTELTEFQKMQQWLSIEASRNRKQCAYRYGEWRIWEKDIIQSGRHKKIGAKKILVGPEKWLSG